VPDKTRRGATASRWRRADKWAALGIALLEDIDGLRTARHQLGLIVISDANGARVHAASCRQVEPDNVETGSREEATRQRARFFVRDIDTAMRQWPTAPVHDCIDQQTQSDQPDGKDRLRRRLAAEDSTIEFLGRSDETEELLRKRAADRGRQHRGSE